jgi:hypothetical protein
MHVVSETPPKYKTLIKLDLPQMKLKRTKSNSKEILTIQQKKLQNDDDENMMMKICKIVKRKEEEGEKGTFV